jgi:gamma-glutamyltranspeptidase/glutathione hydrolase
MRDLGGGTVRVAGLRRSAAAPVRRGVRRLGLQAGAACLAAAAGAQVPAPGPPPRVAVAPHAMVVSQQPLASGAGLEILQAGGNAVDAGVATALALAVTHPRAGNLGGGGFLLYYRARDSLATFIDFRETAPARAHRDLYLGADGRVDTLRLRVGPGAAGVPGSLAGLQLAWAKYGSLPWNSLVAPAVRLAREGFVVDADLAAVLVDETPVLSRFPATAAIFLPGGRPLAAGDRLVQPDLARTLDEVARSGALTFYEGVVAERIVQDMERHGGLVSRDDLARYRAVERRPLRGRYRGLEILAAPPPSSGGMTLLQTLALLEPFELPQMVRRSAPHVHLVAEALARAFADRNAWLGDPDFVPMPLAGMLAPPYLDVVRSAISPDRATPAAFLRPGDAWRWEPGGRPERAPAAGTAGHREGDHTTHLSVVDARGDVVALTTTLNSDFGCGAVVEGAGFLLNNEMDDFTAQPGVPNQYGLRGSDANAIAPGKRMLSSMAPTIVLRAGRPWLVLGSRGGPRIITAVLNLLLDVHDHGLDLEQAVAAPRFHDQGDPDVLWFEPGALDAEAQHALRSMGHTLRERTVYGSIQAIEIAPDGTRRGVSDPRDSGAPAGY